MSSRQWRPVLLICALGWFISVAAAQTPAVLPPAPPLPAPPAPTTPKADPPPARDLVAARVNGQAIAELAVFRSLMRVPPGLRAERRKSVLNYLIDNMIVDQYLVQLKIQIEPKEVQQEIEKIKSEADKEKLQFDALLKQLLIDEDELRSELMSTLRWDKFVLQQGTDEKLRQMFEKNIEMFNGSLLKARHILIAAPNGQKEAALTKTAAIKKAIEDEVAQALAKLPPGADAITREKERARVLDKSFAEAAMKESSCPSKKEGGDLGFFPRAGKMVEPFARAAFTLKPYQMSDPVPTEFGYHLILAVDFKPGKEVKFDQPPVKAFVQEVYAERLREAILGHYKPKSTIEIIEQKK